MNNRRTFSLLFFLVVLHGSYAQAKPVKKITEVKLTLREAIYMALENNLKYQLERLSPAPLAIEEALAEFDPSLSANLSHTGGATTGNKASATYSKKNTTGTVLQLSLDLDQNSRKKGGLTTTPSIRLTKPLKKGGTKDINLVRLHQAILRTDATDEEIRGAALSVAGETQTAFWRAVLAANKLQVYSDSLDLARRQLDETQILIKAGRLAGVERVASQAELASREEDLMVAQGELEKAYVALRSLLNPPGDKNWNLPLVLDKTLPPAPPPPQKLEPFLKNALKMRPDLAQANLLLKEKHLSVMEAGDGLLPKLDFFLELSSNGFSTNIAEFVRDTAPLGGGFTAGLQYQKSLGQRAEKAGVSRASLDVRKQKMAVENLKRLMEESLRRSLLDTQIDFKRIASTAETRKYQESKSQAEQERYRVGKSTSLAVAQVQRDLLASRISETEARVRYEQSLYTLYENDASLLDRMNVGVRLLSMRR